LEFRIFHSVAYPKDKKYPKDKIITNIIAPTNDRIAKITTPPKTNHQGGPGFSSSFPWSPAIFFNYGKIKKGKQEWWYNSFMAAKKRTKKKRTNCLPRRQAGKLLIALFAFLFFVFGFWFFIFKDLPSPTRLTSQPSPISTQILDRQGKLLYEIYADQNRLPIKLSDLPPHIKQATIAIEDKNFYKHHGFDPSGWLRASFNIVFHQKLQGGSTITQQLVKNSLLSPERTFRRKIKELVLSLATETLYSKDQILEMYLNQVPYGSVAYGVEAAAQTYFGKPAAKLSLAEAALLAGLPASPTVYSPFGAHPELAKERQKLVLQRMAEDKYINENEKLKMENEKLEFAPPKAAIRAPHFVMFVKEQLVEKYGQQQVEQGGLRVTTTLDLTLQEFAQKTIADSLKSLNFPKSLNVSNGAALVTNPKTGEILAMVGSKDYFAQDIDGNVNIATRLRQPGSAIKPINYALALMNHKITPTTVVNDQPTCFLVTNQKPYCPDNYDGQFHGPVQVRFALGNSYNIPAVKVLALNGINDFIATASAFGITTFKDPKNYGLSLTLGGGEVKMVDMAVAFGVFANLGERVNLISILKVEDYKGKVLEDNSQPATRNSLTSKRVIPQEVAYLISHILLDNNARSAAFGPSSYLVVKNHPEVSVKTGTTNDKRDNWTIGYNAEILVATWVGNNDNTPMSAVASGVSGASPIWNKIISKALEGKPQKWPSVPEGIVGASVCALTGTLPGDTNCPTRYEYFLADSPPSACSTCSTCATCPTSILINKLTHQPVSPGEIPNNQPLPDWVEYQDHPVITDPLGTAFCLDCPFPSPVQIRYPLSNWTN
jgi:1A family penicillin-binding protein